MMLVAMLVGADDFSKTAGGCHTLFGSLELEGNG